MIFHPEFWPHCHGVQGNVVTRRSLVPAQSCQPGGQGDKIADTTGKVARRRVEVEREREFELRFRERWTKSARKVFREQDLV